MTCILDADFRCPYEGFIKEGSMTCEECEIFNADFPYEGSLGERSMICDECEVFNV